MSSTFGREIMVVKHSAHATKARRCFNVYSEYNARMVLFVVVVVVGLQKRGAERIVRRLIPHFWHTTWSCLAHRKKERITWAFLLWVYHPRGSLPVKERWPKKEKWTLLTIT